MWGRREEMSGEGVYLSMCTLLLEKDGNNERTRVLLE